MMMERVPAVLSLTAEEKLLLAEELLEEVERGQGDDLSLRKVLQERLEEHRATPEQGVTWEELRARLLHGTRA